MLKKSLFVLAILTLTCACASTQTNKESDKDASLETTIEQETIEQEVVAAAKPVTDHSEMKPHTSSVPGTMNQIVVDQEIPEIEFSVTSPKQDEVVAGDEVQVTFDLKRYNVSKEIGQHIHVIVDNEPYIAHYDATKPVVLRDLAPGTHVIRAFPARHYHLALKKGDVFKTVVFHVKEKSASHPFDPSKPYLTYSRPKGSYDAESAKAGLLLDYYVSNTTIDDQTRVSYSVDGVETIQTKWEPVVLPPLGVGEHTVTLKLIDKDGKVIENGGFNQTTRTITVTPN